MELNSVLNDLQHYAASLNTIAVGHVASDGSISHLMDITIVQDNGHEVVEIEYTELGKARFGRALGAETSRPNVSRLSGAQATTPHVAMLLGLPTEQEALIAMTGMPHPTMSALLDIARGDEAAKVGRFVVANSAAELQSAAVKPLVLHAEGVLPEGEDKSVNMDAIEQGAASTIDGVVIGLAMRHTADRVQRVEITTVPVGLPPAAERDAVERVLAKYALATAMHEQGMLTPKVYLHSDAKTGHPVLLQEIEGDRPVVCARRENGDLQVARGAVVAGHMRMNFNEYMATKNGSVMHQPTDSEFTTARLIGAAIGRQVRDYGLAAAAVSVEQAGATVDPRHIVMCIGRDGNKAMLSIRGFLPDTGHAAKAPAVSHVDLVSKHILKNVLARSVDGEIAAKVVNGKVDVTVRRMTEVMAFDLVRRRHASPEIGARYTGAHYLDEIHSASASLGTKPGGKQIFPARPNPAQVLNLSRRVSGLEP